MEDKLYWLIFLFLFVLIPAFTAVVIAKSMIEMEQSTREMP